VIMIVQIDDFLNTGLYDDLRAFVAGEQRDVQRRILERGTALVQDGVDFGVTDVVIFFVQIYGSSPAPREVVVGTTTGETVIAAGEDFVRERINDARTDLRVGVLGTLGG